MESGLRNAGLDIRKLLGTVTRIPRFARDIAKYRQKTSDAFPFRWGDVRPFLTDRNRPAADLGTYFYQDLWAARKVLAAAPMRHVDVGSRIDGFVAHLLCTRAVEVVDIRPLQTTVEGLKFVRCDAATLACFDDDSVESLSSLHAIEHFGLGRYGDPIDSEAWLKALKAMQRVLKPGGKLYLSVPIGRQRVQFNGQRIFSTSTIVGALHELEIVSFSVVFVDMRFAENVNVMSIASETEGCGLFEFEKPASR